MMPVILPYKRGLDAIMKYVYAILIVVDNNPIMQTYVSDVALTGRQLIWTRYTYRG